MLEVELLMLAMNLFCFLCTSAEVLLGLPHTEWSLRYNWKRKQQKRNIENVQVKWFHEEMVTWYQRKTLAHFIKFSKNPKVLYLSDKKCSFSPNIQINSGVYVCGTKIQYCMWQSQPSTNNLQICNYLEWLANPSNSFLARSTMGVTLAMHPGTPRRRKDSYILTSSFMLVRNKTIIFMQEQDKPGSFIYSGPMWNRVAYRPFALLYVVFLPFCGSSCLVNSFTVSWSFLSTTSPNTAIQCLEKNNHSPLVQLQPIIIKCNL